jgi:hypothetical protein
MADAFRSAGDRGQPGHRAGAGHGGSAPWGSASVRRNASPQSVAQGIFDGVGKGEEDIFPDPLSATLADGWQAGRPRCLSARTPRFCSLSPSPPSPSRAKQGNRCAAPAGGYELTPVMRRCRQMCEGAVRSGWRIRVSCVGSSAGLMLLQVTAGVMSLARMAGIGLPHRGTEAAAFEGRHRRVGGAGARRPWDRDHHALRDFRPGATNTAPSDHGPPRQGCAIPDPPSQ